MTRRHLLACLALVAVLTAGCGVRPSGVITGGPAPTERARGVTLYFLAGSSLTRVLRHARQPATPTQVLGLLQRGPDGAERAAHLTSDVPAGLGPVGVTTAASGAVDVVVTADVTRLPAPAVDQIVCTVRDALSSAGPITLRSATGTRGPRRCPAPDQAPGRSETRPSIPPLDPAPSR